MVYFSFEFAKWLGYVLVILCCICVFTLAEMKICLCAWEFSGVLGEEMKPTTLARVLGLGGKMDQTWVVGYFGGGSVGGVFQGHNLN